MIEWGKMDGEHNRMLGLKVYVKPDINIGNNVLKVDLVQA